MGEYIVSVVTEADDPWLKTIESLFELEEGKKYDTDPVNGGNPVFSFKLDTEA